MTATLEGVRVLDLTRNLAGPYCTMTLGDLGADVVKVEHPAGGDDTRTWAPPSWGGESATYLTANRNKRSVVVDLDSERGGAIVRELARRADVVVESFRPGSLAKRGLSYDALVNDNPGLIYCSVSAFGQRGPMRHAPGYDPVLQAHTGIMHNTGEADGPPVRLGIGAIDLGAGLWATIGILTALDRRRTTGKGCRIETSLYEVAVWWMSYHLTGYLASGTVPARSGTSLGFITPYQAFNTADGVIFVAGANDNLFGGLCEVLDLPDVAADPRFRTNADRLTHRAELLAAITPVFLQRSAIEWEAALQARGVPCSRVRTIGDVVADAQLAELGLLAPVPGHPLVPDLRLIDLPVSRDGMRAERYGPPPLFGQHTDEVLASLGYTHDDIAKLRADGVIR